MDYPSFIVRGYGRAAVDPDDVSPDKQEALIIETFHNYKRSRPAWQNAEWGGFFLEPHVSPGGKFRERNVGSLLVATSQPGDVILTPSYEKFFHSVEDAFDVVDTIRVRRFHVTFIDIDFTITSACITPELFKLMEVAKNIARLPNKRRSRAFRRNREIECRPFGHHPAGWTTAGYLYKGKTYRIYVPFEKERKIARWIESQLSAGETMAEVVRMLHRKNIKNLKNTPFNKNNKFTVDSVKRFAKAAREGFPLPNGSTEPPKLPFGAKLIFELGVDDP